MSKFIRFLLFSGFVSELSDMFLSKSALPCRISKKEEPKNRTLTSNFGKLEYRL